MGFQFAKKSILMRNNPPPYCGKCALFGQRLFLLECCINKSHAGARFRKHWHKVAIHIRNLCYFLQAEFVANRPEHGIR